MINPEIKQARRRNWKICHLERDTQLRSKNKNPRIKIVGLYKRYLFKIDGFRVYLVNGEQVRDNLYIWFGIGGHGRVHAFIPNNEIWIELCKSYEYTARTIIHEIHEYKRMAKIPFYHAHLSALAEELKHPIKIERIINLLNQKNILYKEFSMNMRKRRRKKVRRHQHKKRLRKTRHLKKRKYSKNS